MSIESFTDLYLKYMFFTYYQQHYPSPNILILIAQPQLNVCNTIIAIAYLLAWPLFLGTWNRQD